MIYVGDGDTDVPSLSLVRSRGGIGVAVYDPSKSKSDVEKRLKNMRLDKRADLITPADFSVKSELFEYLSGRCKQIAQRYRAEQIA
jgi:predicted HAD superfamily phosphohydrolase